MALLSDDSATTNGQPSAKKRKTAAADGEGTAAAAAAAGGPVQLRTISAVAGHDKDINAVAVAPNDQFAATASQDRTVRVWSLPDLVQVRSRTGSGDIKRGLRALRATRCRSLQMAGLKCCRGGH
jgi:U3 small nucleolar RNA-associated protein 13